MKQFELKTEFFTDYGLANAVFDQLSELPGWRFPENSSDTVIWDSQFGVVDLESKVLAPLTLRFKFQVVTDGVTGTQLATFTVSRAFNYQPVRKTPSGSEWIEVGKRWEVAEILRNL